jgi:hypothetical protein
VVGATLRRELTPACCCLPPGCTCALRSSLSRTTIRLVCEKIALPWRALRAALRPRNSDDAARKDPEVITMPRSVEENLDPPKSSDQAEYRRPDDAIGLEVYVALREAITAREAAEHAIAVAVSAARSHGVAWATIGILLGTSGEAVQQRYGQ